MWNSSTALAALAAVALGASTWWTVTSAARVRGDEYASAPRTVTVANLLLGALVFGGATIAVAVVAVFAGASVFFAFHVVWFAGVLGLPLGASMVLLTARRAPPGITRPARVALVMVLALAVIGIYGAVVEPDRLDVERVSVPLASGRAGQATVRVGVISDIQTRAVGAHELRAIDTMMAQSPDIVLVTGDVYQGQDYVAHEDSLRSMLSRLRAPGGVFLVQGDSDESWTFPRMVEGTGVTYLHNDIVKLEVGDRQVTIGGIGLVYNGPAAQAIAHELEVAPGDGDIRILAAHRPDAVYELRPQSRVDLVAAGHTHGGQISVPWFGPLFTLSDVPRAAAAGGLHDLDGRSLYVSKGVGLERNQAPQVRLNVVPNIGIVELG